MTSRNRFPKPPCPPKVDSEITLGDAIPRMQQTMDISRATIADSQERLGDTGVLLREWIEWCESTGRAAHAADLIERTRAEMRNS
jgi:hypothetical protein